jgi:hypothetical protein
MGSTPDPTTRTRAGAIPAARTAFPGLTDPSADLAALPLVEDLVVLDHVQARHLDLDFDDRFSRPGAHLRTHGEHVQRWHP